MVAIKGVEMPKNWGEDTRPDHWQLKEEDKCQEAKEDQ